jgi:hypothetical protein
MLAQPSDVLRGPLPAEDEHFTAILTIDLANSQVSPFETTTPKILKRHLR